MAQKTPLYDGHIRLGAKMVDFAGWEMPIQYRGLREEHLNTRKNIGLFDVSHMGEIRVKGPMALESLQWLTSNNVSSLKEGQAQYSLLTNENGGIVDDLIIYCLEENNDYLLCVNAANIDKDFNWIVTHNKGADVTNESDIWGQIAVQGPKAMDLLISVFGADVGRLSGFHFMACQWQGGECLVAKTGYTGEDGCEVFVPAGKALELWDELLDKGEEWSVQPVGLGARDTLRLEMKYSLYGHEITDTTSPYEAGLGWVVKPQNKDFIGKEVILAAKDRGLERKLVGFEMMDKGIPRQDYEVLNSTGELIGVVTSGTMSPSLNVGIGIAYVLKDFADIGNEILIQVRQRQLKARVIKTPFVTREGA